MDISINLDYRKYGIGIMVISINLDYRKYGIGQLILKSINDIVSLMEGNKYGVYHFGIG